VTFNEMLLGHDIWLAVGLIVRVPLESGELNNPEEY